jgi:carboxyl-terminal processing protease
LLTSILHRGRTLSCLFVVFLVGWSPAPVIAQMGGRLEDPRREAAAAEKRGDWLGACLIYDELLRKDRNQADVREAYRRCLRQAHLNHRHRDPAYREAVAHLTPEQAQALFVDVLRTVSGTYVDRDKVDFTNLVLRGVEELRFSLDDEAFVREYLPDTSVIAVDEFRERLATWEVKKPLKRSAEAKQQLAALAHAAQACGLPNRPLLQVGIALECAAGACNSLDEYSLLLFPGSLIDGSARSRPGSLGMDLGQTDGHVEVTRIYPHGAAGDAGLMVHDRIVRVGDKIVGGLRPNEVVASLRGEVGSGVELEVVSPPNMTRVVKLVRRSITVDYCVLEGNDPYAIGYIRIPSFHDNTVSEVQEALMQLQNVYDVKAVIVDLRGNPGGSLTSALQVCELFLSEGVLAHSISPDSDYNRSFRTEAHNPFCTLPMAVLVDGETASSAELVAGALKDHNRARILGQTTYGKGSIQCLFDLKSATGSSIRLTVARFSSPTNQPYTGVGLTPHDLLDTEGEAPVQAARQYLAGMLRQMSMR